MIRSYAHVLTIGCYRKRARWAPHWEDDGDEDDGHDAADDDDDDDDDDAADDASGSSPGGPHIANPWPTHCITRRPQP